MPSRHCYAIFTLDKGTKYQKVWVYRFDTKNERLSFFALKKRHLWKFTPATDILVKSAIKKSEEDSSLEWPILIEGDNSIEMYLQKKKEEYVR